MWDSRAADFRWRIPTAQTLFISRRGARITMNTFPFFLGLMGCWSFLMLGWWDGGKSVWSLWLLREGQAQNKLGTVEGTRGGVFTLQLSTLFLSAVGARGWGAPLQGSLSTPVLQGCFMYMHVLSLCKNLESSSMWVLTSINPARYLSGTFSPAYTTAYIRWSIIRTEESGLRTVRTTYLNSTRSTKEVSAGNRPRSWRGVRTGWQGFAPL